MKRIISALLISAMSLSMLSGCGNNTGEDPSSDVVDEGKKISITLASELEELDPNVNAYYNSTGVLFNMFAGLYGFDKDLNLRPVLAESYTVDETGTKYVFTLKQGLTFSDGSPLNAHDIEYSWKRVLDPETASKSAADMFYLKNGKAFYEDGIGTLDDIMVKATDDYTLEVELESPTPYFISLTASPVYAPVKKSILEEHDVAWKADPATYVCNGPYMLTEIKPQEGYTLKKNPNYVFADEVKIDTIEYSIIETSEAQILAFENGDIDIATGVSQEQQVPFIGSDVLDVADRAGLRYFCINTSVAPFDDVRVRRALSLSIDRQSIVEDVLQSTYKPLYGIVAFGVPYGTDTSKDYREVAGDMFKEDVAEAQRLLAEAGFPNGEGFPVIDYKTIAGTANNDVGVAMQEMWKQNLGIETNVQPIESKLYWDHQHNGTYHICLDGWTTSYDDPMSLLSVFEAKGQETQSRYASPEYNALLTEILQSNDNDFRMEKAIEAETILMNDMPLIPVYNYASNKFIQTKVKDLSQTSGGHMLLQFMDVVDEAAAE